MNLKIKKPKLVNAFLMSIQNPESFDVPSKEDLSNLKINDLVKICCEGERFWVLITQINENELIAVVDNDLVNISSHGLRYGDIISLRPENIYSIYEK